MKERASPQRARNRRLAALVPLALAAVVAAPAAAAAVPRVAVSIKPLHSLVAGVMEGVGSPELVLRGSGSPHAYSLRPSEARLLESVDVIFWVGGPLEAFLERPLAALGAKATIVSALRLPGVATLQARAGGAWDAHGEHGGHEAAEPAAGEDGLDPHLWLDPANARAIAGAAAEALAKADPANRGRYAANAARLAARIDALEAELAAKLAPLRAAPYVVFHDAYQYLERRYALRAVGSIAVSPERAPGARRVREVREKIRGLGARCIFGEPQFPPALLATLAEGTGARAGELDPLGAALPPGPDAWFALMRALADSLAGCLR